MSDEIGHPTVRQQQFFERAKLEEENETLKKRIVDLEKLLDLRSHQVAAASVIQHLDTEGRYTYTNCPRCTSLVRFVGERPITPPFCDSCQIAQGFEPAAAR